MGLLAFDRGRLVSLRLALSAADDDLYRIRCDDIAASETMRVIRGARRTLAEIWLPRVHDVLTSDSMTSYRRSNLDGSSWELGSDPIPSPARMYGPPVPGGRSFDEVLSDIRSGDLVPMTAPMDANGRAGAHYTSLAFAPSHMHPVGQQDLTSNVLKFIDFMSDGLPVGWREHRTLEVVYLANVRVVSSVHVLTAYDRDSGPETLTDRTTEAIVSGYMVVEADSSTAEASLTIGPGDQDPTQSYAFVSESSSAYSGAFYPEYPPDFQPITREPRYVNPAMWTFTTSASPMVDGWGTWGL